MEFTGINNVGDNNEKGAVALGQQGDILELNNQVKDMVSEKIQLKTKLTLELTKKGFPDLEFLFSEEVLDISLDLLNELLDEEKEIFENFLKIEDEDLNFESFHTEEILSYFWNLLNHYKGVDNSEKLRKIIEEFRPKYEDFGNYIAYNKSYYNKLLYIFENVDLDREEERVMELKIKNFKDIGIDLSEDKQENLKSINKKLSKLSNDFSNNIVDSEAEFEYHIIDSEIIKDLPEDVLNAAKVNAKEKDLDGYLFDADPTAYQAIMKYCSDSKVRKDFATAGYTFASSGKYDNRENVLNILKLKKEKSELLGYKNYAEFSLNSKMAESPNQVFDLIEGINKNARDKAYKEFEVLKDYFDLNEINAEDLAYYSRIYKENKFDIDDKEVKKYFELENTISYLHDFVKDFFGVELKQININSYNEDVRVYEVHKDGKLISYYFADLFYRKEKRPGAWANNLRQKEYHPKTKIPVVLNVCNFMKNVDGKTTIGMRDVETLFHEFGHALHEILSESKHDDLSGFNVEWDFVELPSQLLENWVGENESLEKLAKHVDSLESMPEDLIRKIDSLKTYMSGLAVARQNEFALLDMNLYSQEVPKNIDDLDKKSLDIVNDYSIIKRGDDYKMYCSFGHIFGGGYSAGYYSYIWAEIIEADVFSKIKNDGMFDPKVGEHLISTLLGAGTKKKASELFKDFMGREPDNTAFMERKGLM